MPQESGTFEIGLAMAGAISAGAYSGGVLDFLFQALEEWEREKSANPDSVPNHNVCIKVITGASAGSITGALAPAALACGLTPTPAQQPLYFLPALYTAWVERPDMALPNGKDLLSTADLASGQPVVSLLNGAVLDSIGDEALRVPPVAPPVAPRFGPVGGGVRFPYIAEDLHLYLTVSNIRGVPYKIFFKTEDITRGHGMLSHGDRAHFIVKNLGNAPRPSVWAKGDPGDEIDVLQMPKQDAPMPPVWRNYLTAALASSAFPVGLSPRQIDATTDGYDKRSWPLALEPGHYLLPDWPPAWRGDETKPRRYSFVNVDGGLINNEPFEYAHFTLLENPGDPNDKNERSGDTADRAVILVDPFPEDPYFEIDDKKLDRSLIAVIKAIFPVLKDQSRFKPNELALALTPNVYSRFLIAPRRSAADGELAKFSIATGLLGGFGGFLDRALRAHDYQLGRRNCQRFLQNEFAVTVENPIVRGRDGRPGWSANARNNFKFKDRNDPNDRTDYYPIIPVVGAAKAEIALPPWPKISAPRLKTIEDRVLARANILVPRLIDGQLGGWKGFLAKAAWKMTGNGWLSNYVHLAIQQDLIRRDQHADWALATDEEREIFAALSDPGFDLRPLDKIVAAANSTPAGVQAVLAKYPDRVYVAAGKASGGGNAYTLADRKPGWFSNPTIG